MVKKNNQQKPSAGRSGSGSSNPNFQNKNDGNHNNKRTGRNNRNNNNKHKHNNNSTNNRSAENLTTDEKKDYPPHWTLEECMELYTATTPERIIDSAADSTATTGALVIRGKLRVLPGNDKTASSFVACDRGYIGTDVCIESHYDRNRGMDGDIVFVQLIRREEQEEEKEQEQEEEANDDISEKVKNVNEMKLEEEDEDEEDAGDVVVLNTREDENRNNISNTDVEEEEAPTLWQDDEFQMDLWNPIIPTVRRTKLQIKPPKENDITAKSTTPANQYKGRVVHVLPPKLSTATDISHEQQQQQNNNNNNKTKQQSSSSKPCCRILVGSLHPLPSGAYLFNPNNKCLPQFEVTPSLSPKQIEALLQQARDDNNDEKTTKKQQNEKKGEQTTHDTNNKNNKNDITLDRIMVQAIYEYGSWKETHNWPPCTRIEYVGQSCHLEHEIYALLMENDVNHGEHSAAVLQECHKAIQDGLDVSDNNWRPTPDMYEGRRDYRNQRIFTIDPTTAKDLDDALHITELDDGTVEIGVHIADVSYFVDTLKTPVLDREAQYRATTVYLVDRTIPMLPRPLCEVACSLNENVERLAFSCVWRMNQDGTMRVKKKKKKTTTTKNNNNDGKSEEEEEDDVWYGRTVIKSCARLDYATAQNIIENKIAVPGEDSQDDFWNSEEAERLWPKSRRPSGSHTIAQVAADVRLMHKVAMARRQLRFANGALALNSTKLAFQLDPSDGQTPLLAAPYPIRDSNRLVEEYMLLANYLVAQRLISHCQDRACLRHHPAPLVDGLGQVQMVAKASLNFDLDVSNSQAMQSSLRALAQRCQNDNDTMALQCITNLLMTPMQPAEYFAAGFLPNEEWGHFALNIPYYTHFTSPIRRYPDIIVHRLLQASIDNTVHEFPMDAAKINSVCEQSNDKRMASKHAQERCDRVFLSLFVRKNPLKGLKGVVLSVGKTAFTVFVPELGVDAVLYLQEHKEEMTYANDNDPVSGTRRLVLQQQRPTDTSSNSRITVADGSIWNTLEIKVFTKVKVTLICKDTPPIDVKARFEGPWIE